jgi:uncharacterized Fe-S cluster-containing radical SAM superfamily protein
MKTIDTARFSSQLRERAIDVQNRRLLVSRLADSEQETDLTVPTNCQGFGRVRHFKQETAVGWPTNPLPIVPACRALGIADVPPVMTAQVFQNAACNWRCWYCYVPFNLLSADERRSAWLRPEELVALYKAERGRPKVLDLSGGSPDLVPEWIPWMMEALVEAGIHADTYLWSDDNLSTTYLFDVLSESQLDTVRNYPMYGRVGCFKGFDEESFMFNTGAAAADFGRQFQIMRRLLDLGIDVYAYVTLTTGNPKGISDRVARFVDQLQTLDANLPLRTVPLEIRVFSPVGPRMNDARRQAIDNQNLVVAAWNAEITRRYTTSLRERSIAEVPLRSRSAA